MTRLTPALIVLGACFVFAGLANASTPITLPVSANMDIYRASAYDDGSDGAAPRVYTFSAFPGQTITFSSVTGTWDCGTPPLYGPDGSTTSTCLTRNVNPVGAFAGYASTDFTGALVGMFLEDQLPAAAPPNLRFYVSNASLGGTRTSFNTLHPKIGQVFFVGDGLTGTDAGAAQVFDVPETATHLYLGYVSSCGNTVPGCYATNSGSLSVTLQLGQYLLDWGEPQLTSVPAARCCASMVYDPASLSTILFGGGNGGLTPYLRFSDTWSWHNGWRQLSPAASPPARQGAGIAYDPATKTVVLFGGTDSNNNRLGDTWLWDGVTWTEEFPLVSPSARDVFHAMTYDPVDGTVLLFGGDNQTEALGDTWSWNGTTKTWKQFYPVLNPPARGGTTLAYDEANHQIVLFGGAGVSGDLNDTWTWNGVKWTQQFPASSPSPRSFATMAYDGEIGEVVLIGGYFYAATGIPGTWTWNGTTWKEISTLAQPSPLYGAGIDFDPFTGILLFGGQSGASLNNTWIFRPILFP